MFVPPHLGMCMNCVLEPRILRGASPPLLFRNTAQVLAEVDGGACAKVLRGVRAELVRGVRAELVRGVRAELLRGTCVEILLMLLANTLRNPATFFSSAGHSENQEQSR